MLEMAADPRLVPMESRFRGDGLSVSPKIFPCDVADNEWPTIFSPRSFVRLALKGRSGLRARRVERHDAESTASAFMKLVVLFGAGATAFSGPVLFRTNGFATSRTPPLGAGPNGLFAALRAEGGVAAQLPTAVQASLIDDFEVGMRQLEYFPSDSVGRF
jgi:hypothetical protein